MTQSGSGKPRRLNKKLVWIILPLLAVAALAIGGVTAFGAHAASPPSPLDGRYDLRAITTSGPSSGLYITGSLVVTVNQSGAITGTVCGLRISEQRCTTVTGNTPDNVHVTFIFHHVKGVPDIQFTGTYVSFNKPDGTFIGFDGTFSFGTSSGTWDARVAGATPLLTGTWNVFGIALSGQDKGQQFHGVLTLIENPTTHRVTGSYCPKVGACTAVTGGRDVYGNYFYYIDVAALNHILRLRGTFVGGSTARISGQFQWKVTNAPGADRGYWIGHA
jgi:hypothetical protein